MNPETIQIKRYPNRRLYDRNSSRYVTLQDIEEMVQRGATIEVRDSKTDEDLTRVILTQIILERHPERMEMFPVAMLHSILRANDLVMEFHRNTFRQSLATLEGLQKAGVLMSFAAIMDCMKAFFPGFLPTPRAAAEAPAEVPVVVVDPLEEKVAELERRLQQLESGAGRRAAPGASGGRVIDVLERRVRELEDTSMGGKARAVGTK